MGIEGHKLLCTEVKEIVLKSCLKMKLNPKTFAATILTVITSAIETDAVSIGIGNDKAYIFIFNNA